MNVEQKPTRRMLVGAAFLLVYLCISIGIAMPSSPSNPESLNKVKEFHDNFVNNEIYDKQNSDIGQLKLPDETIFFPWAPRQTAEVRSHAGSLSTHPQEEKIIMSGSQSKENVQDLKALNTVKQRDILYNESQIKNSRSSDLSNSMDIRVQGGPSEEAQYPNNVIDNLDTDDLKTPVNNAPNSHSNYMNIEVSGITVNAINTVEDGSAVATSNIIINPAQVIDSSSQASDKV